MLQCVGFSTMISSLSNATGECSASSTGVTITSERQAAGLRFTYPTFKASLGILVKARRPPFPPVQSGGACRVQDAAAARCHARTQQPSSLLRRRALCRRLPRPQRPHSRPQANTAESGGWGFTRPFSWGLWLALFVTLIVFPVIIFLIEFLSLRRHVHKCAAGLLVQG